MQTVTPAAPATRTLTVFTRLLPDGVPLSGVSIVVIAEQNGETMTSGITSNEGSAVLRLENVPAVGRNVIVNASRLGQQQRLQALVCNDTTITLFFNNQASAVSNCARLEGVDSLRFRTEPVSDSLVQHEPSGIAEYTRCWSFVNSGNDSITLPITAQIRNSAPFRLNAISINGRSFAINLDTVRIPPSGTLSLCFAVSTANAGSFSAELSLGMFCRSGERGVFRLRLRALVVAKSCECQSSETSITTAERIAVGASQDVSNVVAYVNQLSCPVSVNVLGIRTQQGLPSSSQPEWSLIEPDARSFPLQIAAGGRLTVRLRFAPRGLVSQGERLLLEIRPQTTQQRCTVAVRLNGVVCRNDCPILQSQNASTAFAALPAVPQGIEEVVSSRLDGNIFVTVPELGMTNSVTRTYSILNPSTSCTVSEVTITPSFSDQYSSRFFTISPRSLTIPPGERGLFQVLFTPPDAATFSMILTDPMRRTGTIADSSFSVGILLNTPTCSQRVTLRARVSNVPDISPILNLRAYRQRTRLKPQEENEVYVFGEQSRRILRLSSGLPGFFPPPSGDIYVDVLNNDSSALPPQPPTIHVVPSSRTSGIALWRTTYAEQDFDNVNQTFRTYLASPALSFTATSIRPQIGQVYAFRMTGGNVALLYVRRVDNGTETNTNGQSGVEFRAIYPIVGR